MTPTLNDIETPAFVVDEARVLNNIARFQAHCDAAGLALRPHIKTHKTIRFARAQVAAGAVGVNCQKIGEAEVMADGGLDDILITFNILGAAKLRRIGSCGVLGLETVQELVFPVVAIQQARVVVAKQPAGQVQRLYRSQASFGIVEQLAGPRIGSFQRW